MWDEVLVVLLGRAETLDVFSGDITDCIVDAFLSKKIIPNPFFFRAFNFFISSFVEVYCKISKAF